MSGHSDVTGWYKNICVVRILVDLVDRGDSCQIASINNIANWPKGRPLNYTGIYVQHG